MTYRKKLIEVALPLMAINEESVYEKMPGIGAHPRGLHQWWSRKPLTTSRAVLFASLVNDPSNDLPEDEAKEERDRLFGILEDLVKWKNSNDENVLSRARAEILHSTGHEPPPVLDPFCGGGSIPVEAQRLGLEAHGADLNPVAVLITKAMIEIPPKFAAKPPVNQESRQTFGHTGGWRRTQGLAEDVRHYSRWIRQEAERRIGHLYPKGPNGESLVAWVWARTVRCPNPACGAKMPLATKFWLSKNRRDKAWVEPLIDREARRVRFKVKTGSPDKAAAKLADSGSAFVNDNGKKTKATFKCLVCSIGVAKGDYIDTEATNGQMSSIPLAVVTAGSRGKKYLSFTDEHKEAAGEKSDHHLLLLDRSTLRHEAPTEPARGTFGSNAQGRMYGFETFSDYFTSRQLVSMTILCDLIGEAREHVLRDANAAGFDDDRIPLNNGGNGVQAYADAIATYLALILDRCADFNNSLCGWNPSNEKVMHLFGGQAIPMAWEYGEAAILSNAVGGWEPCTDYIMTCLDTVSTPETEGGAVRQADAASSINSVDRPVISTDPPYYDNVSYADLTDFFYVWLRRSLGQIFPEVFSTLLVPKSQELVVTPYRFEGSKQKAREFFEKGLGEAFDQMKECAHPDYPITLYYAFKQTESKSAGNEALALVSIGWETMLEGLLGAGFEITGTWPMRSEQSYRVLKASGANALASSIVLVCRPRRAEAHAATRQEFVRALRRELPQAISVMTSENIAPVDLLQATIGPGMGIFSRYAKVVEADGSPMRVRTALQLINNALDNVLSESEGEVDSYSRFAISWLEQHGMNTGPYADAETIATARGVAVGGVQDAGILTAKGGKVRLIPRNELPKDWDPASDERLTDWEAVQYLIRALEIEGETGAAQLLAKIGDRGERARDLAYRLHQISNNQDWTQEALAYNGLVMSWPEITRLAAENPSGEEAQTSMDF